MGKKSKNLLQFILLLVIFTTVMVGTWVWRASKEPPLTVGDRIILNKAAVGQPTSFGITLYNTHSQAVRLTGVQMIGEGWEMPQAQMIPAPLDITAGPLSSWASQKGVTLPPVANYRIKGNSTAVLGLTVRKTSAQGAAPMVVVSYRYWGVLKGEVKIPLQ